ncbi:MAG TPA: hypothetical protein PKL06_00975 [Chitinophagales bacterium]|nr:hypothetical protein [Chitinophagales bacterium]
MMQNTIKAGSITHLTDARFFAAYNVDYIGFCFDPQSASYIAPDRASAIRGWVTGPKIVAEFAHQDADNLKNIVDYLQPDVIQIPATEWPVLKETILALNKPVIIAFGQEEIPVTQNGNIIYYLMPKLMPIPAGIAPAECMFELQEPFDHFEIPPGTAIHIKGTPEDATGIKAYDAIADWLEAIS